MVVEKVRLDGSKIRVSECVIGDATGTIVFTARDRAYPYGVAHIYTLKSKLMFALLVAR